MVASEGKSRSAGAQEPECILKYMRIPSTAGTRGSERSRFFHKLSAVPEHHCKKRGLAGGAGDKLALDGVGLLFAQT